MEILPVFTVFFPCIIRSLDPGRFCARHRLELMVDVLDRHCAQHGCDRQPIYGQAGEKEGRPMWCPDHRPVGSFDVKTSRCQEPGCLKHPRCVFVCLSKKIPIRSDAVSKILRNHNIQKVQPTFRKHFFLIFFSVSTLYCLLRFVRLTMIKHKCRWSQWSLHWLDLTKCNRTA